jgi:hypothetical protein
MRNISTHLAVNTLTASQSVNEGAYTCIGHRIGASNLTSWRPLSQLLAHEPRRFIPSAADVVRHLLILEIKRTFEDRQHWIWRSIQRTIDTRSSHLNAPFKRSCCHGHGRGP